MGETDMKVNDLKVSRLTKIRRSDECEWHCLRYAACDGIPYKLRNR